MLFVFWNNGNDHKSFNTIEEVKIFIKKMNFKKIGKDYIVVS